MINKCWMYGKVLSKDWTAIECPGCYKKLYGVERIKNFDNEVKYG